MGNHTALWGCAARARGLRVSLAAGCCCRGFAAAATTTSKRSPKPSSPRRRSPTEPNVSLNERIGGGQRHLNPVSAGPPSLLKSPRIASRPSSDLLQPPRFSDSSPQFPEFSSEISVHLLRSARTPSDLLGSPQRAPSISLELLVSPRVSSAPPQCSSEISLPILRSPPIPSDLLSSPRDLCASP